MRTINCCGVCGMEGSMQQSSQLGVRLAPCKLVGYLSGEYEVKRPYPA
jgi:hypothetical protein